MIVSLKAWCLILGVLCSISIGTAAMIQTTPWHLTQLQCEGQVAPRGLDVRQPRLSWQLAGGNRGLMQTGYRILVASSPDKLAKDEGDLWDSGKILSNRTTHIRYGATPLPGRITCYWKVKVWTNQGGEAWSQPTQWTMGLLARDWQAEWIGMDSAFAWEQPDTLHARLAARYFRKTFTLHKTIQQATLYIVGLGLYQLHINGTKTGDQVLAPVPTDYTESVFYNTFDVTRALHTGANALGVVLGNGRYFAMRQNYKPYKIHTFGYPKLLLQLDVTYGDGSRETITTDNSWKMTADGPIRANNEYDGEDYNALKEMPGWSTPAFDDGAWLTPQWVAAPEGTVRAQPTPNMKIMEAVNPISIHTPQPGIHILDMGQNMAGWLAMRVTGAPGDTITLRFAETLQEDGTLYTKNLRDAYATDTYIVKGQGVETWEPTFVYHGFRYVEIKGYPGTPQLEDFTGKVIYDEMATIGTFQTSDTTLNQIYHNAYWGIRSNYKGMPVDCPQRNERQPWLGDRAMGAYGESFIFNNAALYAKWLQDIEESQTDEGRIPDVAPNFWFYYKDNMTWPGTYLMVANMLHRQFGDLKPIADHYASMKQWLAFMEKRYLKDGLMTKDNYGDWCVPPESQELIHSQDPARKTEGVLIAAAYHYYLLTCMEKFAGWLQKPGEAATFHARAAAVKTTFHNTFFDPATHQYNNGTVTANLLPLAFGITPDTLQRAVFAHIVHKIEKENNRHISTGVIGTQWLMRTLTRWQRGDLALTLATNRDYPSWGYMVAHDATTIWELWNGDTANPAMNSHNHVMLLGDLIVWCYENLAGIQSDPEATGFQKIIMNPLQTPGLHEVTASYQTVHGLIESHWQRQPKTFSWQVTIPPNTQATLYLPAKTAAAIREGGKALKKHPGIHVVGREEDRVMLTIGSGTYHFQSEIK